MVEGSNLEEDIEEISQHIKQLMAQREQTESIKKEELTTLERTGPIAGEIKLDNIPPEDTFEVIESDAHVEEPATTMKTDSRLRGNCDFCGKEIVFVENLSGLVIHGEFFTCEKCCKDASKEDLDAWTKSKEANSEDVKPIALWLMQEKHRTTLFR
jgi:hypothetical protein